MRYTEEQLKDKTLHIIYKNKCEEELVNLVSLEITETELIIVMKLNEYNKATYNMALSQIELYEIK